jgi:hypothetical protein
MITPSVPPISGDALLAVAKANLSRFIHIQARATARLVGFGWEPTDQAPADFLALRRAYLASSLTRRPLPVSSEHSDGTIYDDAETNYAFRFWHDVIHVRLACGFDLDSEVTVARAQLDVLAAAGWRAGSPEYELLRVDTLGQTICAVATGEFPRNQWCFARRGITTSIGTAIRAERNGSAHSNGVTP